MKILLKILFVSLLFSCSGGYIVTTNMQNLANYETNSQIYTLPKTRLIASVKATKTEYIPGPYHLYAKKYLGIEDARAVSVMHYNIDDVKLHTQDIADPDFCFSVKDVNYNRAEQLINSYRESGLILKENVSMPHQLYLDKQEDPIHTEYTDLSIKPFYHDDGKGEKYPVSGDNSEELPLWLKQISAKTTEEKAAEAAKFIIKIRKRRFKLTAGQYEVFPEGTSLETAVRELNELEQKYLSLFIGKERSETISRSFTVVPKNNEELQRFSLFRFSSQTGFHPAGGRIGEAVILQLTDLNANKTLTQINHQYASEHNQNILLIRLPDRANVKIFLGSHEILESEISVFQFGALIPKYVPPVKTGLF